MQLTHLLLAELERESVNTRKILGRVPEDQFTWQPHPKSMPVIRLASHIAEIPGIFVTRTLQSDELDFANRKYSSPAANTSAALMQAFDDTLLQAVEALKSATDEDLARTWTMRNGEKVIVTLPKRAVIRTIALNHIVHHRGQLSVYLRLLDIPVPGMYGPSADEIF